MNKGPYSILIVDDDKSIRDVLEDFLEERGYYVKTSSDGFKAIETIKTRVFDIIILDLKMPGMHGLEVLKTIKQLDPDSIVIIMTGYASLETAIEAIREGAYNYLTKPFRLEEMHITIKNACDKISLLRQNRIFIEELRRIKNNSNKLERQEKEGTCINQDRDKVIADLERLAGLVERGMLTREEFNKLKELYF